MSWSFIQGSSTGANGSAHTRTITPTTGNLMLVGFWVSSTTDSPTISDTAGNTWTQIDSTLVDSTNVNSLLWWYAIANGSASDTITIANFTAGQDQAIFYAEYHS